MMQSTIVAIIDDGRTLRQRQRSIVCLLMIAQIFRTRIAFSTAGKFAGKWLLTRVCVHMTSQVIVVVETFLTVGPCAHVGSLARMGICVPVQFVAGREGL